MHHPSIIHAHQSAYARSFLEACGFHDTLSLSDYTNTSLEHTESAQYFPKNFSRDALPIALFNPSKQSNLTSLFIHFIQACYSDQIELKELSGLTKEQIESHYNEAHIYLELGHGPGKDRMPREASARGCVVYALRCGAHANNEDLPIPAEFKFCVDDLANDASRRLLAQRIINSCRNYQRDYSRQLPYRISIANEGPRFREEIKMLVGYASTLNA